MNNLPANLIPHGEAGGLLIALYMGVLTAFFLLRMESWSGKRQGR